jgi:magnesium-transporting ATPase (P-type)
LSADNLILRGSSVKGTDFAQGIIVYAGKDTKIMMNAMQSKYKFSRLEKASNFSILIILLIQTALCALIALFGVTFMFEYTLYPPGQKDHTVLAWYMEAHPDDSAKNV